MSIDFEKVLKEKLSPETFALISADEQAFGKWIDNLRNAAEECGELAVRLGWIPCSERMPEVENEVLILAKRKYGGGRFSFVVTTAMYEDGTVRENDSCWNWEEIEGEWDEEEDCYIIPEGWWEYRHYNPDDVYNNEVDDKVIAWMPLPGPYREKDGIA